MSREDDEMIRNLVPDLKFNGRGWARINCPFCGQTTDKPDKKQSLGVHVSGKYHCFKCATAGKMRGGVEGYEDRDYDTNASALAAIDPPHGFTGIGFEPGLSARAFDDARAYMRKRNVPEEVWFDAQIGACVRGKESGRIVVPIFDGPSARRWAGYVARDYTGKAERKYLYPQGMSRGELLYQAHLLEEETSSPVFVVEGVFDTFPFWGRSVALLGKMSGYQKTLLRVARRPVVLVLDGDAHEEGYAIAMQLRLEGVNSGAVRLPPGKDPDEVDPAWLLDAAYESLDFGIEEKEDGSS